MKNFLLALLSGALLLIIGFTACKNDHSNHQAKTEQGATPAAGDTAYICPMDCEDGKLYDQPGKCPVCNMNLEPTQRTGATAEVQYFIDLKLEPQTLTAGKAGNLSLTPKKQGAASEPVVLDLVHEKKMHLIVVSDDLSWFDHVHPEYSASGSYDVRLLDKKAPFTDGRGKTEMKLENGGRYWAFVDYKPSGGRQEVSKIELNVNGEPVPASTFDNDKLIARAGGFSIHLQAGKNGAAPVTGEEQHLVFTFQKNGKPVNPSQFEPFLGEKGHLVLIERHTKTYVHAHPKVSEGMLGFHATFEKPGTYRGWLQFQEQGEVHTADFTLVVAKGQSTGTDVPHDRHNH
jgi:hypothetical protein